MTWDEARAAGRYAARVVLKAARDAEPDEFQRAIDKLVRDDAYYYSWKVGPYFTDDGRRALMTMFAREWYEFSEAASTFLQSHRASVEHAVELLGYCLPACIELDDYYSMS